MTKRTFILRNFKIIFPLIYFVSIGCLVILLHVTYRHALQLIKHQFNEQQFLIAKQTAVGIEENIKLLSLEINHLSRDSALKSMRFDACRRLMELFAQRKELCVSDVRLVDASGILKIAINTPQLEGMDVSGRDYFKTALSQSDAKPIFEFLPSQTNDAGKRGILIGIPIYSPADSFCGIVAFVVKVNSLIETFIPLKLPKGASCIIDSSGKVLCDPKKIVSGELLQKRQRRNPAFRKCIDDAKAGKIAECEYHAPDGRKMVAITHPLAVGGQIWAMIIATPMEELKALLRPFTIKYALSVIIVLCIIAGFSFLLIYLFSAGNRELSAIVKARTRELSDSQEKLRTTAETINDLLWEIDKWGKYIYVSPLSQKMLGYPPDQMVGKTLFDFMPEEDAHSFKETFESLGCSKESFTNLERTCLTRRGELVVLESNGAPLLDETGMLVGFRGADRDITLRKNAEIELQQYARELEEARGNLEQKVAARTNELKNAHELLLRKEKFAAIGEIASSISHELRNPLGVINNAIYFFNMKKSSLQDDSIIENINIISREINIANSIITGLLDFTRNKTPVQLKVSLDQLAREMLSKSFIPDNVSIKTDFDDNIPPVVCDPTQLAQIFHNLIENGLQSMAQHGGVLTVQTQRTGNACKILFSDEGTGIAQSDLDRIFEPLFTTKAKGIGLGLAISKSMAQANGIDISVASTEGKGSTFTLTFPNAAGHA